MTKPNLTHTLQEMTVSHSSRSETARLREVFDQIDAALLSGVNSKAILEALHNDGFTMTQRSFESAVYRIRKQRVGKPTASSVTVPPITSQSKPTVKQSEKTPIKAASTIRETPAKKPSAFAHLAVDHEARKKEDPNYYNPTPDLEKIYGRKNNS